ncbi:MAG: DNA replication/repair protein RecF [Pseudomonadota bacterium]
MHLSRVEGANLRRVASFQIVPAPGINAVFGANGAGKTTLLEAIYLLGVGRSFRTHQIGSVISTGSSSLRVMGEVCRDGVPPLRVGVEKAEGRTRIRVGGRDVKASSEVAREFPLLFMGPDSVRLLSDGSEARRRWLDWMVFHVEPEYQHAAQRYARALRQRNALLKTGERTGLSTWDRELAEAGDIVDGLRQRHWLAISTIVMTEVEALVPREVALSFRRGWAQDSTLSGALAASRARDCAVGHTSVGPHRADVRLSVGRRGAKEILSRGESKLLVAALHLAQAAHCVEVRREPPLVLVDELASELDATNRGRFLGRLAGFNAQVFITAVERELFPGGQAEKVFHVERGDVREML